MQTDTTVVQLQDAVIRQPEMRLGNPVNWEIKENEHWVVIGANGAGKTILADLLKGKYMLKSGEIRFTGNGKAKDLVRSIAFKDIYSLVNVKNTYYQQRWHSTEQDEAATVRNILSDGPVREKVAEIGLAFHLEEILDKQVILLSSGELRKFLIIRVLLENPKILILDNPFIGLDAPSRTLLTDTLSHLARISGLQVIMLLSNPDELPQMITHVLPMHDKQCLPALTRELFLSARESLLPQLFTRSGRRPVLPVAPKEPAGHEVTFRMENVSIRYGTTERSFKTT